MPPEIELEQLVAVIESGSKVEVKSLLASERKSWLTRRGEEKLAKASKSS